MAKWVASSVLDNGLNQIRNNATRMLLLNNYTAGQSYATITGGSNVLATVTMSPGTASSDFLLADGASSSRTLTTVQKSATAGNNSSTPDLHIAFTNGVDTVYWVTDETSNQSITSGNTVNFPAITYQSNQPT